MIVSFADKQAQLLFDRQPAKRFDKSLERAARKKLELLDAAVDLNELRVPPGNRLEALRGDRQGQHSIRINDAYRLCFRWHAGNAYDVEIVNYHRG